MANSENKNGENVCCSFCGKHVNEVDHLFAGPAVFICDECVNKMSEMLEGEDRKL